MKRKYTRKFLKSYADPFNDDSVSEVLSEIATDDISVSDVLLDWANHRVLEGGMKGRTPTARPVYPGYAEMRKAEQRTKRTREK